MGKIAIPIPQKVGITITLKSLHLVGIEVNTHVVSILQVADQVQDCIAMWLSQIGGVLLGNLVCAK